jgi:hypothetical protein
MVFAFSTSPFDSRRNFQRGVAITLLLCIHIAAIGLLLRTNNPQASLQHAVREIIISFPTFHPNPVPVQQAHSGRPARTRSITAPIYKLPRELAPPAPQPDLSGVGHSLFGCDPAAMMNRDEQASCGVFAAKPGSEEVGMPKKSRVVQAKRWEYELAIKQSHRLVPCIGAAPGPGGSAGIMVDPICIVEGLFNGFGEQK